ERIQSADAIADGYDTAVENIFPEQSAQDAPDLAGQWSERGGDPGEAPDIDQYVASRPTLAEHLAEQVNHIIRDPGERMIASFLTDSLNDAGYLTTEPAAIAEQLGASIEAVEAVLAKLQGCDPVGVFARDVRECLAIQL